LEIFGLIETVLSELGHVQRTPDDSFGAVDEAELSGDATVVSSFLDIFEDLQRQRTRRWV
jgi:hypothetical protein